MMRIKKLWLATIAALWCSLTVSAHDFEVGGIYYRITSPTDLTVAVTSGDTKYSGSITIPATVTHDGVNYSVTSIGLQAFYGCSSLTSITIPEGVTSIEQYAFNSCRYLTSITIPASVTSIGDEAFNFCSSLTTIVVAEENPTFDSRDGCNAIIGTKSNTLIQGCNSSTIPEGVTSIGDGAFSNFSNLTSITIPEGVTSIDDWAFHNCSNLTSITIPASVTSIGYRAFYYCSNLTEITIHENSQLTSIGYEAFGGVKAWYNNQPDGVIYIGKVLYKYKGTMPANTSIEVKEGTKGIAASAFSGCSGLTSISIPASVTSIGDRALSGTAWFNNQPDGVVYIGKVLYSYKGTMPENTSIEVKDGTTGITDNAFYGCTNLTSITIPSSVTSIGGYAFSGCSSLTAITIPEGVTRIERATFYGCSSLTIITIPEGVTSIGVQAFYGCSSLTSITIPSSVTSFGIQAFLGCSSLTAITIPENMESIGGIAFSGCSSLKTVINYSNLTLQKGSSSNGGVGGYAESVINIDKTEVDADGYLFKTINGVPCLIGYFGDDTELTLPDTYKGENYRIVESAFSGCTNLTSITIPSSVTSIGNSAFSGCSSLESITIPEGVTGIGVQAFYGCSSLTSINIPEGVTSIGNSAFSGCSSLTTVTIPRSVTSIGAYAFSGCSSLTSITIPEGVTSIGSSAFSGCSSLESITIPEGVTSIGRCAFSGCTSLASIYMKWFDPVSITSDVFYGVDRNTCTLYVPGASLEKYRLSSIWGEFNNLLAWYKVAYIVDGEEIAHQWLFVGDEISKPILEGYEGYSFAWEGMISKPINIADNADAMLYTNAPCTNTEYGDQFVGWHVLFDDDANTFFHSEYSDNVDSADGLEHYLRVDMGEGKSINEFSFSYTVRGNQDWCTPKVIVVEGSNDADGEYAEIAKLTDLPSDRGAQYNSKILGNGTSYRYIRYRVIETTGNEKVKGKPYFYIAEFGMTEVQRFEIEETNQMPAYDVVVNGYFVNNDNVETDIHTSELEAQGSQVIYDLMGRRVEKMENGIYIVNGKKVVIK